MEDDDLFWRCHLEGMTNDSYLPIELKKQNYLSFDGLNSYAKIPFQREYRGLTTRAHTISALVRCYQQPEKNKVFLIGDQKRKYVEYPIFRIPGYDYGLSFNNSRALSYTFWNSFNKHNYMWLKRYDKQWSWITAVLDDQTHFAHLYLNGTEVDSKVGLGSPSPLRFDGRLKNYGSNNFYLGMSPSEEEDSSYKFFKGDIALLNIWNRALTPKEVSNLHYERPQDGLMIDINMNKNDNNLETYNVDTNQEDIKVPNSIIPHRVEGRMRCLPHPDEGIVDGKFVKGETTARNERRYVLEMQKGSWDYKGDGIKQLKYELVQVKQLTPWAKMIDIKL